MWKANSLEKNLDAGKDWRQEKKWAAKDEMLGWYHQLNGYEFEETRGDSEGEGSLVCCMQSMVLQRVQYDWGTEQQQQIKVILYH